MRIAFLIILLSVQISYGQFITRDYSKSDTSYYLNGQTIETAYFEDNNYYIDFTNIEAPCYLTDIVSFESGIVSVDQNGLTHRYFKNYDKLCMSESKWPDWYGHGKLMEIEWENGYCDRFSKAPLKRMQDHETPFIAKFKNVNKESTLRETIEDFQYAQIKGVISTRSVPVGKRSLNTIGFNGIVELFRIEEKITVDEVFVYSKSGKKKEIKGFEKSKNFREITKRRFELLDPETGIPQLRIIIKDFQKTIIEGLIPRINHRPKDILPCNTIGKKEVFLYPNPSFGEINLKFEGFEEGVYTFDVYNLIGKPIYSTSIEVKSGNDVHKVDLIKLKKGTYLYSISDRSQKRLLTRRLSIVNL